MLLVSARVPAENRSILGLNFQEILAKGFLSQRWEEFTNGQGIARHTGLATLGSCHYPYSWTRNQVGGGVWGEGRARAGAPVRSCYVKGHTHPQTEALAEANWRPKGEGPWVIQSIGASWRHRAGQQRSRNILGWREDGGTKGNQYNNYRTLQNTEILNNAINHSPLVLHLKETYCLKKLAKCFNVSIIKLRSYI